MTLRRRTFLLLRLAPAAVFPEAVLAAAEEAVAAEVGKTDVQ
jgi:hypothetical protein